MFSITKRLEQAKQAACPREHQEPEHVKAGRNAETTLVSNLRLNSGIDSSSIFCGLRIPDEYQTRKREIDIVLLVNSGIICLEVKNWSGSAKTSEDGRSWIQTKNRKFSDNSHVANIVEHENGSIAIKQKAMLLKDHFSRKGVFIHEKQLKYFVILVNKNCELETIIREDPTVITANKSEEFVRSFKKGYLETLQETITPSLISGKLSYSQMSSARSVLSSIGTWDVIELNGGKRLYGDYKGCPGLSIDRSKTEALVISHQRNYTLGMAWAAIGYTPTVTVSLLERYGSGWLWSSYTAVVKIPYNTEIVFRVCGDENDSKISVNDVVRVQISI
jgi:hypothetical protein